MSQCELRIAEAWAGLGSRNSAECADALVLQYLQMFFPTIACPDDVRQMFQYMEVHCNHVFKVVRPNRAAKRCDPFCM
jgi:hypothetical protein